VPTLDHRALVYTSAEHGQGWYRQSGECSCGWLMHTKSVVGAAQARRNLFRQYQQHLRDVSNGDS